MAKIWAKSPNGTIEYVSLTSEYLEGAHGVMRNSFYMHENVCRAVGLPEHPEAIPELDELTIRAARDGVSFVAVECNTRKVVGVAFNKLQVKGDPDSGSYFENYARSCSHSSSRGVAQFMHDADATYDFFQNCNVDCLLEIMFLATLPDFQNQGIGLQLCKVSIEAARALLRGENIKQSIDGTELTLEPVPKIVTAIFTSPISQKFGRVLEWELVARISYTKFFHEGRSYASVLGDSIPDTTLEYKKL